MLGTDKPKAQDVIYCSSPTFDHVRSLVLSKASDPRPDGNGRDALRPTGRPETSASAQH